MDSNCLMGMRFPFGVVKMFQNQIEIEVPQYCSKLFTFEWLIFCLMNFTSRKRKVYKKRNEQDLIKVISNVKKGKALQDKNIKKMQQFFMRNICLQLLIKGLLSQIFPPSIPPFLAPYILVIQMLYLLGWSCHFSMFYFLLSNFCEMSLMLSSNPSK